MVALSIQPKDQSRRIHYALAVSHQRTVEKAESQRPTAIPLQMKTLDKCHINELRIGTVIRSKVSGVCGVVTQIINEYPINYRASFDANVVCMDNSDHWHIVVLWDNITKSQEQSLTWDVGDKYDVVSDPAVIHEPVVIIN